MKICGGWLQRPQIFASKDIFRGTCRASFPRTCTIFHFQFRAIIAASLGKGFFIMKGSNTPKEACETHKTIDMTQGRPLGLLLRFAVPLMLGSLCQVLYAVADGAVVGRSIGVDAFASIGAANFLTLLAFEILLGLTQGFGVVFAQLFGKKDYAGLRKAVAAAILLSAGISVLLTAAGLICVKPVLMLMDTPADILPAAQLYVYWIYGGIAVTLVNRLLSTLLLSLGNSKAPVTANVSSCLLNILLDLLFAAVFHWGVAGVAAATVAAQLGSAVYCAVQLRSIPHMRLSPQDFSISSSLVKELLRLGLPMAFRNGVIAVGGLFVQTAINGYGKLFVAGMAASEKFFELITFTGSAFEGAFGIYSAQNFGAGDMPRLKKGLRCSVLLSLTGAAGMAAIVVVFGKKLIGLLMTGDPGDLQQIVQTGYEYLVVLALTVPLMFLLCLYRAGLQGMGSALVPTLSAFVELGMRLISVLFLPGILGKWAVYFASPLGWLAALLLLGISYHQTYRRQALTK